MEVFMHNLPENLTVGGLKVQLEPFLRDLGIVDFHCEKPGKQRFGLITFLHKSDGDKFLARHGEEFLPNQGPPNSFGAYHGGNGRRGQRGDRPRTRPRLSIMGKGVHCRLSDRTADEITLRTLAGAAEDRVTQPEAPKEESTVFDLQSLSCGHNQFVHGEMTFVSERSLSEPGMAKFFKRKLVIDLRTSQVQIRIPLSSIVEMVQGATDSSLLITLSTPPVILTPKLTLNLPTKTELPLSLASLSLLASLNLGPSATDGWYRALAIDSLHKHSAPYCLVYRLKLSPADFHGKMKRVASTELITITRYNVPAELGDHGVYAQCVKALKEQLELYNSQTALPFGILFSLQALVHNGYLHPATVSKLAERLRGMWKAPGKKGKNAPISVDAMKKLFEWIEYPRPFGDPSQFEVDALVEMLHDAEREIREGSLLRSSVVGDNDNVTWTYRAFVSPTRTTLHGPEVTTKNRILRKFPEHQDCFIRAQFGDENGEDLFFNAKVSLDQIYDRFKQVLKDGIHVAGRTYSFLGFSHSSLRAHSAWFCSPFFYNDKLNTHFTIIDGLGDFSVINSPARRAARIGQAFSETPFSVSLSEHEISVSTIKDVTSADGQRVFSDGVGTLSELAMLSIWSTLPQKKADPTCFQIRYAGAKGMLCYDPHLPGRQVCVRPSMIKFTGNDTSHLEICDMATEPIPLVLNRQLIKILEDMGAPADWFLRLQTKELNRLRGITTDAYNTANFLEMQSIGHGIRLPRFLRQVHAMDMDYRQDRFLRTVVEAVVLKELRLLKHKARIPVKEGITLFGVMDETGYLEEDEVYITCDALPMHRPVIPVNGHVLVTRSPALHPGDVQLAFSVALPPGSPLAELRNCIVFSQKGDRDLPSQLSGGDLDGDIYNVIWDATLDVNKLTTFPPADYPRVEPLVLDRQVTKDDMANFFVDFMKTDHLGVIATRHMILADQMDDGTLDYRCTMLAQLHSTAVDFSKTGIPVELTQLPRANKFRPDFLAPGPLTHIHNKSEIDLEKHIHQDVDPDDEDAGPRHKYYKSNKLLGTLYRAVDERRIWFEEIKTAAPTRGDGETFWDEFLASVDETCSDIGPTNWERRTGEARRIRYTYEDAILSAMNDFSDHPVHPLTELEVFVGFIINKTGVQTQRQRDRSTRLRDEFERISAWILSEMRNKASSSSRATASSSVVDNTAAYHGGDDGDNNLRALELCLACVHVGCGRGSGSGTGADRYSTISARYARSGSGGLQSFRVVAAAALLQEIRACQ